MPLPPFEYLAPRSLEEALDMLGRHGAAARPMAGGTDLLLKLRHGGPVRYVVGLRNIPGLDYVRFDKERGLAVGPMASLAGVASHPDVARFYPALAQAAAATATVQIRNMGTVTGNLCNASPAADTATPLWVHGAEVVLARPDGERVLPLASFFRGPGQTALEGPELVREIRVSPPGAGEASDYQRLSQRSKVDITAVSVAALVALDGAGLCVRARLALGAVGPTPLGAPAAEAALVGAALTPDRLAQAAVLAAAAARPISDVRASAGWRKKMVEVLARRALAAAIAKARGEAPAVEAHS